MPVVDRLAAHLDRAVGDQHERAAGGEVELVLAVARAGRDAERRVALERQERRLAVRAAQERREVAGADDRQPLVLEVQQRVGERGHLVGAEREREPVEPLDDAAGEWPSSA